MVLIWQEGSVGRLRLNRPAALNALDLATITSLQVTLDAWRHDPAVSVVVLDGVGDAFCAGGDIKAVHASAVGDHAIARSLWQAEYRLDAAVARYPKPLVVLMDGITMGGGIGLGGHASVRVVTERSVLAMPEVAIGLAPDVGGLYLLARAPGEVGTYVALSAARLDAADAVYCGLADHVVAADELESLCAKLDGLRTVTEVREVFTGPVPTGSLAALRSSIDHGYAGQAIEQIFGELTGSPTAMKVTLRAIRNAAAMTSLEDCLRQDYRLCVRFLGHPDLREGIRAAVIDKDRKPRWHPASLAEVPPIESFFTPLGDYELVL